MILEIKEFELPEGKPMHDNSAYPAPGLYAINDGISYHLVYNPPAKTGMAPFMMPIPIEIVKEYFADEQVFTAKNVHLRLINKIEGMEQKLKEEANTLTATTQYYQPEKIDGETLLKAIAIAQNPELAKDLLQGNND